MKKNKNKFDGLSEKEKIEAISKMIRLHFVYLTKYKALFEKYIMEADLEDLETCENFFYDYVEPTIREMMIMKGKVFDEWELWIP